MYTLKHYFGNFFFATKQLDLFLTPENLKIVQKVSEFILEWGQNNCTIAIFHSLNEIENIWEFFIKKFSTCWLSLRCETSLTETARLSFHQCCISCGLFVIWSLKITQGDVKNARNAHSKVKLPHFEVKYLQPEDRGNSRQGAGVTGVPIRLHNNEMQIDFGPEAWKKSLES